MPDVPARPDPEQFGRRANDLLQAAERGDPEALARIHAVSDGAGPDAAELAVAREHGFPSWQRLRFEVDRRTTLDSRDVTRLRTLLSEHPEAAVEKMTHWCDHPRGASPLGYVAMMRFDTTEGRWRDVPGSGALARALLDAGAPVDGDPNDPETPLITAASYGDAEVARVLVEAGADLNAKDTRGMTPIDSAMGRAGGNSRGGQRVDVHEDTAALLKKLAAASGPATNGK